MKRKLNTDVTPAKRFKSSEKHINDQYFESYADIGIHQTMLADKARSKTYFDAFKANKEKFKDAVVLDVGAGTGILSLMAAKCGAKKVYAVEASTLAKATKQIIEKNGFEGVIEVIHSKVEEVELSEKVDIIISEWMGYFLYHESMLESVLFARDRWLKPNGLMFPERATVHLEGFHHQQMKEDYNDFWKDVYGFNFTQLIPSFRRPLDNEIQLVSCEQEDIVTTDCQIGDLNLYTVTKEDVSSLNSEFELKGMGTGELHGIIGWFKVYFPSCNGKKQQILSTSPWDVPTHWEQSAMIFALDQEIILKQDQLIKGEISLSKSTENFRCYEINLDVQVLSEGSTKEFGRHFKLH